MRDKKIRICKQLFIGKLFTMAPLNPICQLYKSSIVILALWTADTANVKKVLCHLIHVVSEILDYKPLFVNVVFSLGSPHIKSGVGI